MRHDLRAMKAQVNERTKLIFIANPNNPTGTVGHARRI
jgi:histidinol-phosphate aminotransferase